MEKKDNLSIDKVIIEKYNSLVLKYDKLLQDYFTIQKYNKFLEEYIELKKRNEELELELKLKT